MIDLKSGFDGAWENFTDPATLAKHLPGIISAGDADLARNLLQRYDPSRSTSWLPEAMMLLKTPNLSLDERLKAFRRIVPDTNFSDDDALSFARMLGRIGRIGFSFPQWRFLAQGYTAPRESADHSVSLLERYGLTRLSRSTDIRDVSLPPGHPNRDHYGTGYARTQGRWHIEFRRAYILCSHAGPNAATMVIRNNSYFYGRDRLPASCYVSWNKLSRDELDHFNEESFSGKGTFMTLEEALKTQKPDNKAFRLWAVLNYIESEDDEISKWLSNNEPVLSGFMNSMLDRHERAGKPNAPFYICGMAPFTPPWSPQQAIPASRDLLRDMAPLRHMFRQNKKIAILSGPNGDFPVRPNIPAPETSPGPEPRA